MINTTLCYIFDGERCLLLHRNKKKNDINAKKWIGVGGKFLENESPDECLLREVQEETGLTLTRYRYRGIVTFFDGKTEGIFMHLFTADRFEGTLTSCDEGELAWMNFEDLFTMPRWAGDDIFLNLIKQDAPFFSLKLTYEGDCLREAVLDGVKIPI
ncbi:MAG: 8-oxo-dGTP diphosphatase [Eubacteriales bacterium]